MSELAVSPSVDAPQIPPMDLGAANTPDAQTTPNQLISFAIGDDQIQVLVRNHICDALHNNAPARRAYDVSDEKNAHERGQEPRNNTRKQKRSGPLGREELDPEPLC